MFDFVSTSIEQLSKGDRRLFSWLCEYFAANEQSPTLKEICDHFNWSSRSNASHHIRSLERAGFIERLPGAHRNIRLREVTDPNYRRIPLLGYVAAGKPIIASLDEQWVTVPDDIPLSEGRRYFALTVKGNSMTEAGILDGDRLIVESKPVAENGQIIIGFMNKGALVKKYFRKGNRIRLESASRGYKSIVVKESDEFSIQGVLLGVVRILT
jgi:repressor LexA